MSEKTIQPEDLDEVVENSALLRLALDGLKHNAADGGCNPVFVRDIDLVQGLADDLAAALKILAG